MPIDDVEDWTAPIALVSGITMGADFPDFTEAVEFDGGGTGVLEITSVDGSITITDPTGPITDLSSAGGGGGITRVTSSDSTVQISNPTGPTTDLKADWATFGGTGQTTPGGDLTFSGGNFTIGATAAAGDAVQIFGSSSGGGEVLVSAQNVVIASGGSPPSALTNGTIVDAGSGRLFLEGAEVTICSSSQQLQFFEPGSFGGVVQQTVTGSRGGNAALASLLTALANYGLIINNSTP